MAFFLLIIACINFMSLTTARSGNRAKEIGMRKVTGAKRADIIKQFYGESILLAFIALVLAIVLVSLFLPVFNNLSEKQITMNLSGNILTIFGLIGITIFTGILSGSYPAIFLSSFQPVKVLKGSLKSDVTKFSFRKILVVTQFSLSIFLIIGTMVIYRQIDYIRNRDLGFNKENVICMQMSAEFRQKYQAVKREFMQNSSILSMTAGDTSLVYRESTTDNISWEGKKANEKIELESKAVDYDYLKTFKMEMAQGRFFSEKFSTDGSEAFILNEAAVNAMGMTSPLGKRFSWESYNMNGTIIGIIKDFHSTSFHQEIGPVFLKIFPDWYDTVSIRIKSDNILNTIGFLKNKLKKVIPDYPFSYTFLDEDIDNLYKAEQRMGSIFRYCMFLALFISCLGLFGLASFMAAQRAKEIAIRKVLGSSVSEIVVLLSKEFTKWIFAANVIAWPLAYFVMNKWLQNFVYRSNIGFSAFVLSAAAVLVVALFAISYQSLKAAISNPVDALKYE